jgi:hypothetical protein
MKRELAAPAIDLGTPGVLWLMMAGELAIGAALLLSDKLPSILVSALQLFLRF